MSTWSKHAPYFGLPPLQDGTHTLSVESLETTISDLNHQIDHLRTRLLSASALLNYQRPINRLPPEVLLTIFQKVQDLCTESGYHSRSDPRWYRVLGVCRYWHALASTAPLLWTSLSVGYNILPSTFKFFLDCSRQLPISVELSEPKLIAGNLNQLASSTDRLKALSLRRLSYETPKTRALANFLCAPPKFPALETLHVRFRTLRRSSSGDTRAAFTTSFSAERFPRLHNLTLESIDLANSLMPLPLLISISLSDVPSASVKMLGFIEFLRSCVQLERLTLSCFRPREHGLAVDTLLQHLPPLPTVHFPSSFQTLILEDIDTFAARLLSAFSIPPSADVNIGKVVDPDDVDETRAEADLTRSPMHTCLPPETSGLPVLKLVDRLRIHTMNHCAELIAMAGQRIFSIVALNPIRPGFAPDPIPTLVVTFRDCPLTELRLIGLGYRSITATGWMVALQFFTRLHTLVALVSWESLPNRCLHNLLQALGSALGDGTMVAPQLSVLVVSCPEPLRDEDSLKDITHCLRAREERGLPALATLCLALGGTCISRADETAGRTRDDFPPREERKAFYRAALGGLVGELQFWDDDFGDEELTKKVCGGSRSTVDALLIVERL